MAKNNIKTGEIKVKMEAEEPIWMDRKRLTIFALPISFTKYTLTKSRLFVETGFLTKHVEEIRLYRIKDISYRQTLWERIAGTGTLKLVSSDATLPTVELKHIKAARKVKDVISQAIELARRENGVRASELVDGCIPQSHEGHPDAHPPVAPENAPDMDYNGDAGRVD